jgi:signal transduction histidine kinase
MVRDTVAHLEQEIRSLRALVTDLRPAALDDLGAQAAIKDLVERARAADSRWISPSISLTTKAASRTDT